MATATRKGSQAKRSRSKGRIVAVADAAEVLIAEQFSSLVARRHFHSSISQYSGGQLDPRIVTLLLELAKSDEFWLGLYSENLAATLTALRGSADTRKSRRRVLRFAEVFADLSDAKGDHTVGHARRTAENAERLANAPGLDSGHVEMIRIGALLHDVGLLGVPARDDEAGHSLCDRDAPDASAPGEFGDDPAGTARV